MKNIILITAILIPALAFAYYPSQKTIEHNRQVSNAYLSAAIVASAEQNQCLQDVRRFHKGLNGRKACRATYQKTMSKSQKILHKDYIQHK